MEYTIKKANEYIKENKDKVNPKFRLNYHLSALCGWINDPNGLIYHDGKYHLYYQYYPYDSKWGPMHWGHAITSDLVHFEYPSVALAPDNSKMESGCFSGGAIVDENKLKLVYTRHYEADGVKKEDIFMATSDDTINYEKTEKPLFDNELLPKGYSRCDFRDPAPYKIDDKYYIFVGGKNEEKNEGLIVVLESDTLSDFKYSFTIGPLYELGDMGECPSYHKVDGLDCLVVSGCHVKPRLNNYFNDNSSVFILGNIDFHKRKMSILSVKECDKGDSFYAPQFIANLDTPMIIGWLEMWGKDIPTHTLNHGWAGAFSIPRTLRVIGNEVYQKPIDLSKYYVKNETDVIDRVSHITCNGKGEFKLVFTSSDGYFEIGSNSDGVYLDTRNTNNLYPRVRRSSKAYDEVRLEILLDNSSVELFINDGEYSISNRIYLSDNYKLTTSGDVSVSVNTLKL